VASDSFAVTLVGEVWSANLQHKHLKMLTRLNTRCWGIAGRHRILGCR